MPADEYTLTVKKPALQVIADHLKRGVYNDVCDILNDLALQVAKADQMAEQKLLQEQVIQAAAALPITIPVNQEPASNVAYLGGNGQAPAAPA